MIPIHILLVEDNEGDILLTEEVLEDAKIIKKLSVAKDGKEAMDFLTRQGRYANAEEPDLILLDVNLPGRNGHEVLQHIKKDENLKQIPVIMLTTSSFKKDIKLAYDNCANCYIIKPIEANEFSNVGTTIKNFWNQLLNYP
jgi:CheY-like chemotaxis protein